MAKKLTKVQSLGDLRRKAAESEAYKKLAIDSASNLGALTKQVDTWQHAIDYLEMHAMETDEESVVGEVNFCR